MSDHISEMSNIVCYRGNGGDYCRAKTNDSDNVNLSDTVTLDSSTLANSKEATISFHSLRGVEQVFPWGREEHGR